MTRSVGGGRGRLPVLRPVGTVPVLSGVRALYRALTTDPEERVRFRTLLSGIAAGRIVYTGPVLGIIRNAEGWTWEVSSRNGPPGQGVIVSAVTGPEGNRYRVVHPTSPTPTAIPVDPALEDGYVALMRSTQDAVR